ncbi:hypothetical protein SNL152K_3087 [Streptomyces sp. NL15-2K]|nr:hypothetical protein SNL152K_3087 [Streptomyces sp. NL15-2K]
MPIAAIKNCLFAGMGRTNLLLDYGNAGSACTRGGIRPPLTGCPTAGAVADSR